MSLSGNTLLHTADKILRQHLSSVYQYLEDPTVQEVMINDPDNIWIERQGGYQRLEQTIAPSSLVSAVTVLANLNDKGVKSPGTLRRFLGWNPMYKAAHLMQSFACRCQRVPIDPVMSLLRKAGRVCKAS